MCRVAQSYLFEGTARVFFGFDVFFLGKGAGLDSKSELDLR